MIFCKHCQGILREVTVIAKEATETTKEETAIELKHSGGGHLEYSCPGCGRHSSVEKFYNADKCPFCMSPKWKFNHKAEIAEKVPELKQEVREIKTEKVVESILNIKPLMPSKIAFKPNHIYLGETLSILQGLPDGCVNHVIGDPPYNISTEGGVSKKPTSRGSKAIGDTRSIDFGEWDRMSHKDYIEFTYAWLDEAVRVMGENGIVAFYFDRMMAGHFALYLKEQHKFKIFNLIADIKTDSPPAFNKWHNSWEMAFIARKGKKGRMFNKEMGVHKDFFIRNTTRGEERLIIKRKNQQTGVMESRFHPCQKSELVFYDFIRWWTREGEIILDPFCGTGTTCKAAQVMGRKFVGIEMDEAYHRTATARCANYSFHDWEENELVPTPKQTEFFPEEKKE